MEMEIPESHLLLQVMILVEHCSPLLGIEEMNVYEPLYQQTLISLQEASKAVHEHFLIIYEIINELHEQIIDVYVK
ncbi:TPA: hypothetical protein DIC40_04380 [Patescibacteria group bacterium]|nr:hypothetical protein [Candidatus Gracilibacteria bacterium]